MKIGVLFDGGEQLILCCVVREELVPWLRLQEAEHVYDVGSAGHIQKTLPCAAVFEIEDIVDAVSETSGAAQGGAPCGLTDGESLSLPLDDALFA